MRTKLHSTYPPPPQNFRSNFDAESRRWLRCILCFFILPPASEECRDDSWTKDDHRRCSTRRRKINPANKSVITDYRQNDNIRWGKIDGSPFTGQTASPICSWRYCFEARLNRTWATDGIFEFPLLSSKNWHFCDFNNRAIIHPLTVNYSRSDKNFKNHFDGPSSIDKLSNNTS